MNYKSHINNLRVKSLKKVLKAKGRKMDYLYTYMNIPNSIFWGKVANNKFTAVEKVKMLILINKPDEHPEVIQIKKDHIMRTRIKSVLQTIK